MDIEQVLSESVFNGDFRNHDSQLSRMLSVEFVSEIYSELEKEN